MSSAAQHPHVSPAPGRPAGRVPALAVLRRLAHPLVALAVLLVLANLLLLPLVARAFAVTGGVPFMLCESAGAERSTLVLAEAPSSQVPMSHDGVACEAGCTALGAALASVPPRADAPHLAAIDAPRVVPSATILATRVADAKARAPPLA